MSKWIPIVLLLVVTALLAGFVAYRLKPSTEVRVSVTVEKIRDISHLATTEYTLSAYAHGKYDSRTLWSELGVGDEKITDLVFAFCRGTVRGRVDMEKATIDVQEAADGGHVSIHFKRGSVLVSGVEIDPDDPKAFEIISAREILIPRGVFKPATPGQKQALQRLAMQKLQEVAINSGIVEKTMENAKTVLGEFVGALGYRATITFDENAYDPSASEE